MAFICAAWTNVSLLLIGIVLFGAGFGNAASMPPLVAQREFVERDVPRVGALNDRHCPGAYAFAPAAFSLVHDFGMSEACPVIGQQHNYRVALPTLVEP